MTWLRPTTQGGADPRSQHSSPPGNPTNPNLNLETRQKSKIYRFNLHTHDTSLASARDHRHRNWRSTVQSFRRRLCPCQGSEGSGLFMICLERSNLKRVRTGSGPGAGFGASGVRNKHRPRPTLELSYREPSENLEGVAGNWTKSLSTQCTARNEPDILTTTCSHAGKKILWRNPKVVDCYVRSMRSSRTYHPPWISS